MTNSADLVEQLIDLLAERVASAIAARLQGGEDGFVDQARSLLGPRRHCAAVRRRIARGESGALVVDRQHYLTLRAYEEEIARRGTKGSPVDLTPKPHGIAQKLENELRLIRRNGDSRPSDS